MTEHSRYIFFFYLAEYPSIVRICILNIVFFLDGYPFDFNYFLHGPWRKYMFRF